MLLTTIQGLDPDELSELLDDQGSNLNRLENVLCNGAGVCVLNIEVDNGSAPVHNYYNVVFANGATVQGLHGAHLRDIAKWK
jgi:hypothetical protein